ncbi:MAG: choice-of-anchor P family protein [Miltoncostaeaceae bacterium]
MLTRVSARVVTAMLALTIALFIGGLALSQENRTSTVRGYAALTPSGTVGSASAVADSRPDAVGRGAGIASELGLVGRAEVDLSVRPGEMASGSARVTAGDVLLLDGRVAISSLAMEVAAEATPTSFVGGISSASATGVVIDGQPVSPGLGTRYELSGVGAVVFFEQVSDGTGTVRANAVRLEVSDPAAVRPVGDRLVVGHVEATVVSSPGEPAAPAEVPVPELAAPAPSESTAQAPEPTEPPAVRTPPTALAPPVAASAPPLVPAAPIILPRRPAPTGVLAPTDARYVFPVHGQSSFIDDYGFPRASTGWHQGVDIFAPTGTPLLAVADGTLSKVGVNRLGGNRLWLTDEDGNEFYYAHLSAFAPSAVNGAEVVAGEVIGFVGNSGEAITTPPHLHFEIHPGGGDSINPHPFLIAWQRRGVLPKAFRAAATSPGPAPAAGAVLVGIEPASDRTTDDGDGLARVVR